MPSPIWQARELARLQEFQSRSMEECKTFAFDQCNKPWAANHFKLAPIRYERRGGSGVSSVALPVFADKSAGGDERIDQVDTSCATDLEFAEPAGMAGVGAYHHPSSTGLQPCGFLAEGTAYGLVDLRCGDFGHGWKRFSSTLNSRLSLGEFAKRGETRLILDAPRHAR